MDRYKYLIISITAAPMLIAAIAGWYFSKKAERIKTNEVQYNKVLEFNKRLKEWLIALSSLLGILLFPKIEIPVLFWIRFVLAIVICIFLIVRGQQIFKYWEPKK